MLTRAHPVPVGTIAYIQDGMRPFGRDSRAPIICRNPWIVTAWLNREYHPCSPSRPHTTYLRGGHLAVIRSLRDGRTQTVADWMLRQCDDAGLCSY